MGLVLPCNKDCFQVLPLTGPHGGGCLQLDLFFSFFLSSGIIPQHPSTRFSPSFSTVFLAAFNLTCVFVFSCLVWQCHNVPYTTRFSPSFSTVVVILLLLSRAFFARSSGVGCRCSSAGTRFTAESSGLLRRVCWLAGFPRLGRYACCLFSPCRKTRHR